MFVNMTAVGTESLNGHAQYCTAKQTYRDAPILSQQDRYLVCATRWQVPTSEVPTIEAKTFEIWEYDTNDNINQGDPTAHYVHPTTFTEFEALEQEWHTNAAQHANWQKFQYFKRVNLFLVPAANSAYDWFYILKSALSEAVAVPDEVVRKYSDRVKITMLPDMRVQIWISDTHTFRVGVQDTLATYTKRWYVKLSRGMFDMCQFQISNFGLAPDTVLSNHIGRRFFGQGQGDTKLATIPGVHTLTLGGVPTQGTMIRHYLVSTAATSAADTFNCHRKLVLTSDLTTKQERTMTNFGSRKRQLVEYDLTQNTQMNYSIHMRPGVDPYDNDTHFLSLSTSVTENLPSARTYTSQGGVDGRWMQLSSPAPLYQLEVTAHLIIWSFEERQFKQLPIPLPCGALYDVKLCFVNRDTLFEGNDHHHR